MSITMEWDNPERTVIRVWFDKTWRLQDALHALDTMFYPMAQSVDHPVCILLVMTGIHIPHNVFSLFKRADQILTAQTGIIVAINPPRVFRNIHRIMKVIYPALGEKFHFVTGEDAAYQVLRAYFDANPSSDG